MTARVWSETISNWIHCLPKPGMQMGFAGSFPFAPRLTCHSYPDEASRFQAQQVFDYKLARSEFGVPTVYWRIKFGWREPVADFLPGFRTLRTLSWKSQPLQHIGYFGEKGYGAAA